MYEDWSTKTPLITRNSMIVIFAVYVLSFFFSLDVVSMNMWYLFSNCALTHYHLHQCAAIRLLEILLIFQYSTLKYIALFYRHWWATASWPSSSFVFFSPPWALAWNQPLAPPVSSCFLELYPLPLMCCSTRPACCCTWWALRQLLSGAAAVSGRYCSAWLSSSACRWGWQCAAVTWTLVIELLTTTH